ncbi:3-ketoacyl-CoA thiolase, mitochondrial [Phytophthora ramorum]|uniref:3-ketoacyl-CoA thiolase, mitochondrial n=1 Tax=Phytophthora ramorum TaxID=164328 RepID=UPI0030A3C49F|nr:3-ketoacyl-CoA thiolase, mitochondrial [Phytophthora ramorum]
MSASVMIPWEAHTKTFVDINPDCSTATFALPAQSPSADGAPRRDFRGPTFVVKMKLVETISLCSLKDYYSNPDVNVLPGKKTAPLKGGKASAGERWQQTSGWRNGLKQSMQCDAFGVRSQARWAEPQAAGWFDAELVPLDVKAGRKTEQFAVDESPRVVDMAKLAKLKPVFKKDGVMTADNAFSISDGAGAVQLVSEDAVKKHNLTPWRVW